MSTEQALPFPVGRLAAGRVEDQAVPRREEWNEWPATADQRIRPRRQSGGAPIARRLALMRAQATMP